MSMVPDKPNPLTRKPIPPTNPQPDRTPRCNKCYLRQGVYGQADIGTPLITETITIIQSTEPSIDIARVTRCVVCFSLVRVTILNDAAKRYGFSQATLCRLLKASRGSCFRLHELRTGALDAGKPCPERKALPEPERETVIVDPEATAAMPNDEQESML